MAIDSGSFAVNIIASHAVDLASTFAGLSDESDENRFSVGDWTRLATGSPILSNALVALDCQLDSTLVKGSHRHRVFFGKVVDVRTTSGEPLLYTDRRFAVVEPVPL